MLSYITLIYSRRNIGVSAEGILISASMVAHRWVVFPRVAWAVLCKRDEEYKRECRSYVSMRLDNLKKPCVADK